MESRPARNSLLISSGCAAEPEAERLGPRKALAPVARVPLELEAPARLEPHDPERARADGAGPPVARGHGRALGEDRRGRVRDDGRKERDRLLELDHELGGREDVEALEVRAFALEDGLRSADRRQEPAGVALGALEEALEREAHVARREGPPVVEERPAPQAEPVPQAAVLRLEVRDEPRRDPGALDDPRQRLEDVREGLGLLVRRAERRVEALDRARDRHGDRPAHPPAGRERRAGRDLPDCRVVDERRRAPERDAADVRARDPVVHVVEERDDDGLVEEELLEPAVERLARGAPRLPARLLQDPVGLGRGEPAAQEAGPRVEEPEREVVGVVVVGVPPRHHDVESGGLLPRVEVLGHRRRPDRHRDAQLRATCRRPRPRASGSGPGGSGEPWPGATGEG